MALTAKQQTFVDSHEGNTTKAAAMAGISRCYGARLMMDVTKQNSEPSALAVQTAIKARNKGKNDGLIANREERQQIWTSIARGDPQKIDEQIDEETGETKPIMSIPSVSDRLRASELLGKSEIDFPQKHTHEADRQSLADIAAIVGAETKQIESKVVD